VLARLRGRQQLPHEALLFPLTRRNGVAAFIAPPESLRGAKTSCSGTRQLYASRGPKMIRGTPLARGVRLLRSQSALDVTDRR
jgi:hypothetical protein